MLSPTVEEAALAQLRFDARGKQRAEAKESSNSKLLNLMRGRDEQLKEELRWRDNHQEERKQYDNSPPATR